MAGVFYIDPRVDGMSELEPNCLASVQCPEVFVIFFKRGPSKAGYGGYNVSYDSLQKKVFSGPNRRASVNLIVYGGEIVLRVFPYVIQDLEFRRSRGPTLR